jgi:hypothetical protein
MELKKCHVIIFNAVEKVGKFPRRRNRMEMFGTRRSLELLIQGVMASPSTGEFSYCIQRAEC